MHKDELSALALRLVVCFEDGRIVHRVYVITRLAKSAFQVYCYYIEGYSAQIPHAVRSSQIIINYAYLVGIVLPVLNREADGIFYSLPLDPSKNLINSSAT